MHLYEHTHTHTLTRRQDDAEEGEGADGAGAASLLRHYLADGSHTAADICAAYCRSVANADGDTAAALLAK